MKETTKHLELNEKLLLKIYSAQILILAKQHIGSLSADMKTETTLETAIAKIHQELDVTEKLVRSYYK